MKLHREVPAFNWRQQLCLIALAAVVAVLAVTSARADNYGSVVGGGAANQSGLAGGVYLSAPAVLTNGQQAGLIVDATTHALLVEVVTGGGSPSLVGVLGANGTTISGPTNLLPMGFYSGNGTLMASTATNTDALPVASSNSADGAAVIVNAWARLINPAGSGSRQYEIDAIGATGTGITAVEEAGASFNNITTATTTTVKATAGTLHKICVNTYVASGTITIYNNTTATGTKIGTVTNPATLIVEGPNCAIFDVYFSTGLTIVTTGAQDITVIYR